VNRPSDPPLPVISRPQPGPGCGFVISGPPQGLAQRPDPRAELGRIAARRHAGINIDQHDITRAQLLTRADHYPTVEQLLVLAPPVCTTSAAARSLAAGPSSSTKSPT
jgi:hypothetical protein